MIVRIASILLFILPLISLAEDQDLSLRTKIEQLVQLRQATLDAPNDASRIDANSEFLKVMRAALADDKSFKTSFDTIPQIADLKSKDKFFRLINWNVPMDDGTHRYHCFIQNYDRKLKQYVVRELKRGYRGIEGEERKIFSDRDWYGALYYQIITAKMKRNSRKRTYMLLGWDGHDEFSTIKFVDVMIITPKSIRFGDDIFNWPERKNVRRIILQYKSSAVVSLKYDQKKNEIVFNQLVPLEPDLEGLPEFYVPLLEFEGLTWKRGKWFHVKEMDMRMNDKKKEYINPPLPQKLD
jgi:hypothetical protein